MNNNFRITQNKKIDNKYETDEYISSYWRQNILLNKVKIPMRLVHLYLMKFV